MNGPGADQVHIPSLMKVMSLKTRNKKEDKKLNELKFGEFCQAKMVPIQLSDNIEDEINFPLFVAPNLGPNIQVHTKEQGPPSGMVAFNESGEKLDEYSEEAADVCNILEGFSLTDEEGNEKDTLLVFDAMMLGEDIREMPFTDRLGQLQALMPDGSVIGWQLCENHEELAEYVEVLLSKDIKSMRVKKPDSVYGEETVYNFAEVEAGSEETPAKEEGNQDTVKVV